MAARPLTSGVFASIFTPVGAAVNVAAPAMLEAMGKATETRAKENLSRRSHAWGTPTPASPGGPPAKISGTLHDAVHAEEPHMAAGGWQVRVGVLPGRTPPYGKTEAAEYGEYLETGETRNGEAYPWLQPAFDDVAHNGTFRSARYLTGAIGRL